MSGTGPWGPLDALLASAAHDHPGREAVVEGEQVLTYGELEERVRELAARLRTSGVRPGDRVGVYVPKGTDALIAVYASLRCGAVAAPLDVKGPPERTARMAVNAALGFLVTSEHTAASAVRVREFTDRDPGEIRPLVPGLGILPLGLPTEPAPEGGDGGYLLFTSGSTGWPKGVLLSHENVLHFARWTVEQFGLKFSDRIGSQASLTFDLSTFDIFGSALSAACLVLLPEPLKAFPQDVVSWLGTQRISAFYAVPTLYQALLHQGGIGAAPLPDLRIIAFAGEPFPAVDLERLMNLFETADFYNLYGPTETNVCTFEKVPHGWSARDRLSIGKEIAGVQVELVDDEHRVTSDEGEIAVSGPTVALGYLQNGRHRALTSPISLADGRTRAAYLTGDLGYYGDEGKIHLRGRRDHQIKRRGYRIDLQDIESVVQEFPSVRGCAAVWDPEGTPGGELRLHVAAEGTTEGQLREQLFSSLPRHMLPDRIQLTERLPLTERGKVDREALASAEPTRE
ncbi:amino acid adenylation domain-containing protein [Streptomyces sp. NBC_00893]|uniref:amino acid adenylation domain-containing protein n=1 Tax=Streptomyces sp. NBC_00893 TaxID=2975862 RepID=UPI0022557D32|nr:amino acid adenylation domain-containing protein [Streptomyces sp. NBC_00893]MCX4849514.1 amino acid adenylation domain-containing protein [Streptomyces sp. NBC_00893]